MSAELNQTAVILVDLVQFLDAIVESYGDPNYELRFRDLFCLMDADHGGTLSDDEVIPFLTCAGLDEEATQTALMRLLGGHINVRQWRRGSCQTAFRTHAPR